MSVNSKMTALADEIRELSGTTEAMGLDAMATNIGVANDEVDSQTELLAQVVSALEGKAAGGGSGGGSVETCNLQVNAGSGCYVYYTTVTNGEMLPTTTTMSSSVANLVVAKNTLVAVRYSYFGYSVTGGTKMVQYGQIAVFSVTADSAVATFTSQDGGSGN